MLHWLPNFSVTLLLTYFSTTGWGSSTTGFVSSSFSTLHSIHNRQPWFLRIASSRCFSRRRASARFNSFFEGIRLIRSSSFFGSAFTFFAFLFCFSSSFFASFSYSITQNTITNHLLFFSLSLLFFLLSSFHLF